MKFALLFLFLNAHVPVQKPVTPEQAGDAYTITTTLKIAEPYDVRAMNDEFQTARLLEESGGVGTFEVTYRPFHVQTVTANPRWREDSAKLAEYLQPRPAANWGPGLRSQILADLKTEGIDPQKLDDKELVEKVSAWALHRSQFNDQFGLWMVDFKEGKPEVRPELRPSFLQQEPKGMGDEDIFNRELFGDGMYRNKTHGSCTSTSTYMATILRAVGIPTRIILTVPACDPNDPTQVKILLDAVRRDQTRKIIKMGLSGKGFVNHVFNEVWVGHKWVRLNDNRLGQPILDQNYCGLMTHVYTTLDISAVPFSTTWGARFAIGAGPKLSSENPYQLISAKDSLQSGLVLDNPPVKELTSVTVIAVVKPGDARLSRTNLPSGNDAILQIKEWIPDQNYVQLREFLDGAGLDFTLKAEGHPDVKARVTGFKTSDGQGTFQGFGIHLEGVLAPGVAYNLVPENSGHAHVWIVSGDTVWRD